MKRMLVWVLGGWALLGGSYGAAQDQVSPTEQVRQARLASNKAILDRKMPEYLATITPDFVITTGNGRAYTRAEFLEIWRVDFANDNWLGCMRTTEDIEVSESAPEAAEHGHFTCVTKQRDGAEFYSGTYLAMWRNDGGVWRTRSELFVTLSCMGSVSCGKQTVGSGRDESKLRLGHRMRDWARDGTNADWRG